MLTAGQLATATLAVLDVFNNSVLGYTGTATWATAMHPPWPQADRRFRHVHRGRQRAFLSGDVPYVRHADANGGRQWRADGLGLPP